MSQLTARTEQRRTMEAYGILLLVLVSFILSLLVFSLPSYVPLLCASAVASIYGVLCLHAAPGEMAKGILRGIRNTPIFLLLTVGTLIASWIGSGTIPFLVDLGLSFMNPQAFLPLVLLSCAILSGVTGSAWTTCGTLGIAFLGLSLTLGIPEEMTLGAILSGAFFGDKVSPLSDYTITIAGVAGIKVESHLKRMLKSAIPALISSLLLFFLLGLKYKTTGNDLQSLREFRSILSTYFRLTPLCLAPVLALAMGLFLKWKSPYPLLASAGVAVLVSLFLQKTPLEDICLSLIKGFRLT